MKIQTVLFSLLLTTTQTTMLTVCIAASNQPSSCNLSTPSVICSVIWGASASVQSVSPSAMFPSYLPYETFTWIAVCFNSRRPMLAKCLPNRYRFIYYFGVHSQRDYLRISFLDDFRLVYSRPNHNCDLRSKNRIQCGAVRLWLVCRYRRWKCLDWNMCLFTIFVSKQCRLHGNKRQHSVQQ